MSKLESQTVQYIGTQIPSPDKVPVTMHARHTSLTRTEVSYIILSLSICLKKTEPLYLSVHSSDNLEKEG